MDYLKINNILYEYFRRDEDGNIEGIQKAIDNVSLSVKAGDFISILGHNGSGKSTLAKLINALLIPAQGTVIVDGEDTSDKNNTLSIRKKTGMVFQNPDNQIIASTVEEDIAFGPENIGIKSEDIIQRVNNALEVLGLSEYRKTSPNHLSGGQKQRVAIAGILAMEPKCIILDEATSMLDPKGRRDVLDIVHQLNKNLGITIILITHNMEEVVDSDYVYIMSEGQIIESGTPREIFSREEFLLENGLDVPPITRIAGILNKNGLAVSPNVLSLEELVEEIGRIGKSGNHSR